MNKTILLANRPDLVAKLEKYGLVPLGKTGGPYEGCAKQWAKERKAPYDVPEYQALAERLPIGWEEISEEELVGILNKVKEVADHKKKARLDTPNRGSEAFFKHVSKLMFLALSSAAALLVENGIGRLPKNDERELEFAKEFSFELVLHLINGTGFLDIIFKNIAKMLPASQENQKLIAETLRTAAIFLTILTATNGDNEKMKMLLVSFKPMLGKGIQSIEQNVSEKVADGILSGQKAERTSLYVGQARVALDKEDYEGFYEAFIGALEILDILPDDFISSIKEIRTFAKNLHSSIQVGMNENAHPLTSISQSM